jgi:aspartate/glutamate racemase
MNVLVAQGEQQDNVRGARYGVLAKACFSADNAGEFEAAIADLVRCGAQAVILRCTEFDSR